MLPPKYNVDEYAMHLRDGVRTRAYIAALKQTIFPGAVVIDLGAGTGFFSLLACQLGAGHVYAIEPNPLVDLLEQQARVNGCADRITIIRDMSTKANLPQRADILLADLRGGMFPLFQQNTISLYDARQRLLKENGIIIPQRDLIFVAPIEDDKFYQRKILTPWVQNNYGVNMDLSLAYAVNIIHRHVPRPEHILAPAQLWAEICYGQQFDTSMRSSLTWEMSRSGTMHFIGTWFEGHLLDGISYSTAPGTPKENRPNTYDGTCFPLQEPIDLIPTDIVNITLQATYVKPINDYRFNWETRVYKANGELNKEYHQSNIFSQAHRIQMHWQNSKGLPPV